MKKRFSAEQWRAWFGEFDQSELTVARFCDSVGVSEQSYYYWRRKLKSESETEASATRFVPVVVADDRVEIEFPGGAIARVNNDANALRPLVEVLLRQEARQ